MRYRVSAEPKRVSGFLALALLLWALAGRLALGALVPAGPIAIADASDRLPAAMIICGPSSPHKSRPSTPGSACLDDQLLIELADHGHVVNPTAPPLPGRGAAWRMAGFVSLPRSAPPPGWRALPETRAPPKLA